MQSIKSVDKQDINMICIDYIIMNCYKMWNVELNDEMYSLPMQPIQIVSVCAIVKSKTPEPIEISIASDLFQSTFVCPSLKQTTNFQQGPGLESEI